MIVGDPGAYARADPSRYTPIADRVIEIGIESAETYMDQAREYVDLVYPECSDEVKATLVAAYVTAASTSAAAEYQRSLVLAIEREIAGLGTDLTNAIRAI